MRFLVRSSSCFLACLYNFVILTKRMSLTMRRILVARDETREARPALSVGNSQQKNELGNGGGVGKEAEVEHVIDDPWDFEYH